MSFLFTILSALQTLSSIPFSILCSLNERNEKPCFLFQFVRLAFYVLKLREILVWSTLNFLVRQTSCPFLSAFVCPVLSVRFFLSLLTIPFCLSTSTTIFFWHNAMQFTLCTLSFLLFFFLHFTFQFGKMHFCHCFPVSSEFPVSQTEH